MVLPFEIDIADAMDGLVAEFIAGESPFHLDNAESYSGSEK